MAVSCTAFSLCVQGAVCKEPCLPPRFRFTTGRGWFGDFSVGTEGMRDCRRLQRDTREPLKEEKKGLLRERGGGKVYFSFIYYKIELFSLFAR